MAINGGNIQFGINYKVDDSGLKKVQAQLSNLATMKSSDFLNLNPNLKSLTNAEAELKKIKDTVSQVQTAYKKAFDPTSGVTNINKLSSELKKIGIDKIYNDFKQLGPAGVQSFSAISKQVSQMNLKFKETNNFLGKMGETFFNTVKWSIASSAVNTFTGAVQQAYGYVQHLDTSLNDIRIVTGKSADEMSKFAEKANSAAKSLGASTTEYTEASLIYYQQGLSDEEAQARAETTLRAANVTGQSAREVSEQLTAVWNGYRVTAEETEKYVDKLAAVAATTASNLEELSTGMSKVASAANNMGVDVDQLNAQLATIISVTRQAPETAGTALKTIYARLEDLKINGEDENGVKLGDVSSTLAELGINVIDAEGNLRDLGGVIEEVAEKWNTWTKAQQSAAAQAMAGKRQYNNLLALFDNWDMYTSALETSRNSIGTLQRQQDIYMESTEAHLQQLKTQWEDFYDSLFDTKDLNTLISGLTKILKLTTDILDGMGGGKGLLLGLVGLVGRIPSINNVISKEIGSIVEKSKNAAINAKKWAEYEENVKAGIAESSTFGKERLALLEKIAQYGTLISDEEKLAAKEQIDNLEKVGLENDLLQKRLEIIKSIVSETAKNTLSGDEDITHLKEDFLNENNGLTNLLNPNTDLSAKENIDALTHVFESQSIELTEHTLPALEAYEEELKEVQEYKKRLERGDKDTSQQELEARVEELRFLKQNFQEQLMNVEPLAKGQIQDFLRYIDELELDLESINGTSEDTASRVRRFGSIYQAILETIEQTQQEVINDLQTLPGEMDQVNQKMNQQKESFENFSMSLDSNRIGEGITKLTSGISSLGFAISSLGNLGDVISDKDLSNVEKFGQVILSLTMGLPMLSTGIKEVKSGLTALGVSAKAIPIIGWALVAISAAFTAVNIVVKRHQKVLENNAEAAKDLAKAQKEIVDKTKKEKQAIDDLANSYQNLANQKEADGKFSEEQKNQIYDLVRAYGDQSLIIKALSEDYKDLEEAIKDTQIAANDKLVKDLTRSENNTSFALQNSIIANAKSGQRDKKGYDFAGLGAYQHQDFRKDLANLLGEDSDVIDASGHITYDNLIKLLTTETEDLQKFLDRYKDLKVTQQIRDLLNQNSDLIKDLTSVEEELTTAKLNQIGYQDIENIEAISSVGAYSNEIEKLTNQALEEGKVKTYEEGKQWASQFLSGYSDELKNYDKKNVVADTILDTIVPSEDEIKEHYKTVENQLKKYQQGGNVDLLNRPIINNSDGSYSTVSTQTVFNKDKGIAINFTPYVVDENGNLVETLSSEALEEYGQNVINGVHEDFKGLQIGFSFTGEDALEKADKAAQIIHELQEDYYSQDAPGYSPFQDIIDDVYDNLEKVDDESLSFIAGHVEMFQAMIDSGMEVTDIIENLSAVLDITSSKDHIVKIDAVIDKKFAQKQLDELFNTEGFDLGISETQFSLLEDDEKYYLLNQQRELEIQQIEQMSEVEKRTMEERATALDESIKKEKEWIAGQGEAWEKAKEEYQSFIDVQLEGQTNQFGEKQANFEDTYQAMGLDPEGMEDFKQQYIATMEEFGKVYNDAVEEGRDTTGAMNAEIENLNENMKDFVIWMAKSVDINGDYGEITGEIAKNWYQGRQNLNQLDKELTVHENKLTSLENDYDGVLDTTIDYKKQVANTKLGIQALNKSIDNIQSSYQSLQDVVSDYNEDGKISLDNLQKILEMDDAYVASLDIQNGQMILNEETSRKMIDAKLHMAKVEATQLYLDELRAIAAGENVIADQKLYDADQQVVSSINDIIEAAGRGVQALNNLADAKAAAGVDKHATDEATKAYYNRLQLIDSMANVPTSDLLGKTDKSSSSSSSKEADQEEHLEREVDLYREVNQQLKQIESTLSRIQKQNSYKWGKDLQEGLKRENKLLDKQLAKLKEKSRIQQKDLAQRRADLESQGISFSKDGSSMKNAESQLDKLYAEYNSMVDQYNSMSAEQQEEYKKQLETKKKDIDKFENDLKNYESLFNEYQSVLDELQELHYAQIENAVERFNNMVDVHLELDDAKKEWADFWYEVVQDVDDSDFGGKIAQSMAKLQTLVGLNGKASKSEIAELTNHLNDTVDEVTKQIASRKRGGEDSLFEDATKLSKENLEKYRDQLMDAVREAKEEVDNIAENYTKILESAKDLIDEQVDGLEAISDHLEHNIELFKIMEGVNAYGPVIREYEKLYQNDLKLLNTQRQSKEFWAGEIDRYEKLLATTEEGTVQWKTYSENLKTASENYKKSVQDLDKILEETLKHLDELRKNQTEVIFNELDKTLSKGRGLDMVEEEWKLINDLSSRYLDNVERALETELYTNDLEKAANAIGLSAENQAKLNNFMDDELAKLKAKNKLTQYDIDESRARLAILQAEIALEEQRNNKSKMRLRRDSQGNYNYQYVGDEQAIEDAENGALTAKKEWYELVKKRHKEVNDYKIELRKQYIEYNKLANEAEQQQDYEKAEFLRGLAKEVYKEIEQNNEEVNKNTQDLISGTSQFFADVANASVLPTSNTVAVTLINDTEEIGQAGQKAVKDLEQVQNEYVEKTKEAIREAGVEYENLVENGIDPTTESLEDLVDTQEDLADKLEDVNDELDTQEENLKKCEDAYRDLKDAAISAIEAANTALEKLSQTAIDTQQKVAASVAAAQAAANASASGGSNGYGGGSSSGQGANGATSSVAGQYKVVETGFGTKAIVKVTDPSNYIEAVPMKYSDLGPDKRKELLEKYGINSYRTGGYTGNWMGEGKLAVLHQKELVLNESDTSNILNAVKSIREIVGNGINSTSFNGIADAIVKMSAMQANMLSEISRSTLSALATTINNNNAEMQNYKNMTVNADFSGVRSADAIYQALRELENYGMQQSYSVAPHSNTSY